MTQSSYASHTPAPSKPSAAPSGGGQTIFRKALRGLDLAAQEAALSPDQAMGDATRGAPGALPHRAAMESAYGQDFGGVQAYTNQGEAMGAMSARAATRGESIAFADASPSKDLVAHEVAHVVQARNGASGVHAKGKTSQPGDAAEVEADKAAAAVMRGEKAEVGGASSGAIHRFVDASALSGVSGKTDDMREMRDFVDEYNGELENLTVQTSSGGRSAQATMLKMRLSAAESAGRRYTQQKGQGTKADAVNAVLTNIGEERRLLDAIKSDAAWDNATGDRTWAYALSLAQRGISPSPDSKQNVKTNATTTQDNAVDGRKDSDRGTRGTKHERQVGKAHANTTNDAVNVAVTSCGWDPSPDKQRRAMNSRFPKGPPLSGAEIAAITTLSTAAGGPEYLHGVGLFTDAEADAYFATGKHYSFHQFHRTKKVQLASVAYAKGAVGTPPYQIQLSMLGKHGTQQEQQDAKQEIDDGINDMWAKTIDRDMNEDAYHAIKGGGMNDPTTKRERKIGVDEANEKHGNAQLILTKLFTLLQAGLKMSDPNGQPIDWQGSVSRALSHGGRVVITVPRLTKSRSKTQQYELTNWLGMTDAKGNLKGKDGAVFDRGYATHRMAKDKHGHLDEKGGTMASVQNVMARDHHIWGMNIAAGGMGERDFNDDVILPDGAHGHMFIGFRPPEQDADGALMVGLETTGPGAKSTVGYEHTALSTEKSANPVSVVGGLKADKIGSLKNPNTVDLAAIKQVASNQAYVGGWQAMLDDFQQNFSTQELVGQQTNKLV